MNRRVHDCGSKAAAQLAEVFPRPGPERKTRPFPDRFQTAFHFVPGAVSVLSAKNQHSPAAAWFQ